MKNKRKICFVIVNRANYGRVKLLMNEIKEKKFRIAGRSRLISFIKKIWSTR